MSLLQNDLPEEFMNWTTLETLKAGAPKAAREPGPRLGFHLCRM